MNYRSITVIIPFRNQLEWLRQAIESLQQQTFQEWVAILINDYSETDVVTAIQEVCRHDSRLSLMHVNDHQLLAGPWLPAMSASVQPIPI